MFVDEEKRTSAEDMDVEKREAREGFHFVENPELEKKITLKTDTHVLPWIFAIWLLAFIGKFTGRCASEMAIFLLEDVC